MADTSFELLGASGGVDEMGVCSFSVPYFASTFESVFSVGDGEYFGVPEVSRTFQANPDGSFTVTISYAGASSSDNLPGRDKPICTLQSAFEEEAIEAHPRINELVDMYGGVWSSEGKVTFPSKFAPATPNSKGLQQSSQKDMKSNPMAGVEKYKKLSVQWSVQYASAKIPQEAVDQVGTCITSPPGNPPKIEGRSNWLVMPVTANKKGNVAEITENYFLLDKGIAPELYNGS